MLGRSRSEKLFVLVLVALLTGGPLAPPATSQETDCIRARVVALDQPWVWNRLGAAQPQGMIFALRRDVVNADSELTEEEGGVLAPGKVKLRKDKRVRPIVLRMHVGGCIDIHFENLLDTSPGNNQPHTRDAGIHVIGLQLADDISDDGSHVGENPPSIVPPGGKARYRLRAEREGAYVLYSAGATTGGEGDGGQLNAGLFGMVNVEPKGSEWYRSQLTAKELESANVGFDTEEGLVYTPQGHPVLDYDAEYPTGHRYEDLPILRMVDDSGELVHSDLTAVIAGFPGGTYPANKVYPRRNEAFREFTILYHDEVGAVQAFPLFEQDGKNGDPNFEHTLHSVRDAFAINYGSAGIGAEILANRFGVGPMWDCTDCKYEEFFLTSWAVGDPAMIVDEPANTTTEDGELITGPKATFARFPDDPSNVYHSYLRDHVKFRIGHGGSKEHHVHHLHAHQWLHTPDSDESAYLDSQTFGPGSSFTTEIAYEGGGNRNLTPGDSIFHCHFYPHFAQGMWALWRVHDVFENGERKLPDGEIAQGTPIPAVVPIPGKAMAPMPQAEVEIVPTDFDLDGNFDSGQVHINGDSLIDVLEDIHAGLPIEPIGNPGYPFWIPGQAGHRPPSPALDTIHDGGLPRHVVVSKPGSAAVEVHTPYDFTKRTEKLFAYELPEGGHPWEDAAMTFHEQRDHATFSQEDGAYTSASFTANGLPRVPGAPYADPCVDDDGNPIGVEGTAVFEPTGLVYAAAKRLYKAADIQIDAIFNKVGWHFPQMRISSLWRDVEPTFEGKRAPEPLFFRANSLECIEYQFANLVPHEYEMDDFQVRTPTDVLGQHIHLVKFDVTASDGAANGFNYEDGSLSPGEVQERIHSFNDFPLGFVALDGTTPMLQPNGENPIFEAGVTSRPQFEGAQTTVQRWMADDVLNNGMSDRTLRTVFTHDHFGPSTHQQAGLYAGLVVEEADAKWFDPVTGAEMGNRDDGGPTSWRADIKTVKKTGYGFDGSFREFLLEFADFQLAYEAGSHEELGIEEGQGPTFPLQWDVNDPREPGDGFDQPDEVINPPGKKEICLPFLVGPPDQVMPEGVSADDVGSMTINYRNEPLALRVLDPDAQNPDDPTKKGAQSPGFAGDLSHAFRSDVHRSIGALNAPPSQWPYSGGTAPPPGSASEGALTGDPFTPLLRAYPADDVQVRVLIGAHEEGHNFTVHGHKWLFEPSWKNSGWRNSQVMTISEHFEMLVNTGTLGDPHLSTALQDKSFADYLYQAGASTDDLWNGLWGLMRVYDHAEHPVINTLDDNPDPPGPELTDAEFTESNFCPDNAHKRAYTVHAVRALDVLEDGRLYYNRRSSGTGGRLFDPTAIFYVHDEDLILEYDEEGNVIGADLAYKDPEPLILRARAGECIEVTLVNNLWVDGPLLDLDGFATLPFLIRFFNANQLDPSKEVGLHTQLVEYNVLRSDGANVGFNPLQTALPQPFSDTPDDSKVAKYLWYAGHIETDPDTGDRKATPVEFGAVNLMSSDRIKHASKGAVGALIVEPEDVTWTTTPGKRTSAIVHDENGGPSNLSYREFVTVIQSDVNMRHEFSVPCAEHDVLVEGCCDVPYDPLLGQAVRLLAETEDAEDSGQKAVNYRTEPMWHRMEYPPNTPLETTRTFDFADSLSNDEVGGEYPRTPVFRAKKGDPVRFRVLKPGGNQRNHVFQVHGHVWEELPFVTANTTSGIASTSLGANPDSMWEGATMGIGPSTHLNVLLKNGAGGIASVPGDYLWRDHVSFHLDGGLWGLLDVAEAAGETEDP